MNTDQERALAQQLMELRTHNCSLTHLLSRRIGPDVIMLLCSCALIIAAWVIRHQDWPNRSSGPYEQVLYALLGGLMLGAMLCRIGLTIGTRIRWSFTNKTTDWKTIERIAGAGDGANNNLNPIENGAPFSKG